MRLKLVALLLLFSGIAAHGQSDVPFKGANRIVFVCGDSAEHLFQRLGQHLLSKGYAIDSNKDFLSIKTKEWEVSKYALTFSINNVIQENKILFTMEITGFVLGNKTMIDWEYSKVKTNTNYIVHDDFIKSMEQFDRQQLYYEKY